MHFKSIKARKDWRTTAANLGYLSTIFDQPPYWIEALDEPFCAVFTQSEIEKLIEPATKTIIDLAAQTVEEVLNGKRSKEYLDRLKVPVRCREAIRISWNARESNLWGRLDLSYSQGQLKLLELNFDGAVSLYEAAVFQRIWLDQYSETEKDENIIGQFSSIHQRLLEAFASLIPEDKTVHFTSFGNTPEEDETIKYLQSCALLANRKSQYLLIKSLGYDKQGRLIDLENNPIEYLVKLYQWEVLFREDSKIAEKTGKSVLIPLVEKQQVHFFEPAWRSLLSNKGILSVMSELFPDCPYLLKAAVDGSPEAEELKKKPYAKKPLHGLQGESVSLVYPDQPEMSFSIPGTYGKEGFLIQELHALPTYNNYHILVGSWVINDKPSGVGIRADLSPITTGNHCLFVPHMVMVDPI